jgi:hypothetical protein
MFWLVVLTPSLLFSVVVALVLLSSGRSFLVGCLCFLGGAFASLLASRLSDEWLRFNWLQIAASGGLVAAIAFGIVWFFHSRQNPRLGKETPSSRLLASALAIAATSLLLTIAFTGPKPLSWIAAIGVVFVFVLGGVKLLKTGHARGNEGG